MFFAKYNDGQFINRETAHQIFALPGEYEVLKYDQSMSMIQKVIDVNTLKPFLIEHFEITKLNTRLMKSMLEIYDHKTKKFYELTTVGGGLPKVLEVITEELQFASKFPNFDIYIEYEALKDEVKDLKAEIDKLKK